jgi:hypothetical protein
MRSRFKRHLGLLTSSAPGPGLEAVDGAAPQAEIALPPELSWRDYAIMLLTVAASIEHALMVQYLYAAYSLGGPQVPPQHRQQVRGWQEVVLGIAKEEMGHFISVLNVLRLVGGPLNLDREDYPWDSEFYPFKFRLEPLTLRALAKYVYVESPTDWSTPPAEQVRHLAVEAARADAEEDGGHCDEAAFSIHQVGALYQRLITVLSEHLTDADFHADTYEFQASFDEWGRNYSGGARGNASGAGPAKTPDVIVRRLASRDDAVNALTAIAKQGEALGLDPDDLQASHFQRFLTIWEEYAGLVGWSPVRPVPVNPRTPRQDLRGGGTDITNPESEAWAHLFNVRYRMLLTYLSHAFKLASPLESGGAPTARGYLIGGTFGEMYNLRALAGILVEAPLDADASGQAAGPTFEMPYTLNLPDGEPNRWRLHRDLLHASRILVDELLCTEGLPPQRGAYLRALADADGRTLEMIAKLLDEPVKAAPKKGTGR